VTYIDGRCTYSLLCPEMRKCLTYHGNDPWPRAHRDADGVFIVENEDGSLQAELLPDDDETRRFR